MSASVHPEVLRQMEILRRGTVEILPEGELEQKLRRALDAGKALRIKEGFDASAPDLHLGHTVQLRKLRQFQDLGHEVIFLIGDFTAMIGDPTGRSSTRPMLTQEEVLENAESYRRQVFKVLREDRTTVMFNSEWNLPMNAVDVLRLASEYTVARMLERDDFSKRYRDGVPISIQEFLYPLFQGYDSVVLANDVEVGGTDQKFNLLVGRELQRSRGLSPQCVLTLPLLVGTDGKEKMSKSLGNAIGIEEPAEQIFGKVMSIPDALMLDWFDLVSSLGADELAEVHRQIADPSVNPGTVKRRLARDLCDQFHGGGAGLAAEAAFDRIFVRKDEPEVVERTTLPAADQPVWVLALLTDLGLTPSRAEARRLVEQGGVSVDGERVTDPAAVLEASEGCRYRLRVGKRRWRDVVFGH
jgi:tyrosyl-tRNA synthetase